tara:strand:+ start:8839 stop:9414 length:576 start_codon:yes stop_codon:yes gene_type:complete
MHGAAMTARDELRKLLIERSVRLGDFTLASGARSDYYIDARRTTMSAEGQRLVGRVAYAAIQGHGLDPTHVGGLTMGADPIAYAIAHVSALEGGVIDGFSVRKSAKGHGTGQRIEGGLPKDARALMVEDTMTTGLSTLKAIDAVRAHGAAVLGVITLVNRSEDAEALYNTQGLQLISLYTGTELLAAAQSS